MDLLKHHDSKPYNNNEDGKTRIFEVKYYFGDRLDHTDYYLPHNFTTESVFDGEMEIRFKVLWVDRKDERFYEACNLENCSGICFGLLLKLS